MMDNKSDNSVGQNKVLFNNRPKYGTIYLYGEQIHFHSAVARALTLDSDQGLSFEISIDLLQSWRNKDLTYRVDYAIKT